MKRIGAMLAALSLAGLAGWGLADTRLEQAELVRKQAGVRFTGRYDLVCPQSVVKAALERPALMGALWASYMYGPGYKVSASAEPGAVHVSDPSGIEGDVWTVSALDERVVYLAKGRLNHWAVPMMNSGTAVLDLGLVPAGAGTQVTVTVSVKPDSWIAGAGLWLLSPIVKGHIRNRVANNLHDAAFIMGQISTEPAAVAARLRGDTRREFERTFVR